MTQEIENQQNLTQNANHIINALFKLAIKYPELSIIISVMLLLLLPLAIVSQVAGGRGFVLFAMFFIFAVVAAVILYLAKAFISAISHSPILKTVSSWCVGLTVLSITLSLGVSASALILNLTFSKDENGLFPELSQFAVSILVKKDEPNPRLETLESVNTVVSSTEPNISLVIDDQSTKEEKRNEPILVEKDEPNPKPETPESANQTFSSIESDITLINEGQSTKEKNQNEPIEIRDNYQDCLRKANNETEIYYCIDVYKPNT